MEVKITEREAIKPSSPTPTHLKNFKLSLIDQLAPSVYDSMLFCYSTHGNDSVSKTSQNLKKSLSKTLTLFYSFAGRTVDNTMIDCSDNGALYLQARVNIPMSQFLKNPDGDSLKQLIPTDVQSTEQSIGFLTLVKVSFFPCGGVAVGVSISHKLADATSMAMFIKSWAEHTASDLNVSISPVFNSATLFPPSKLTEKAEYVVSFDKKKLPLTRVVFDSSRIVSLKSIATPPGEKIATRAEAVTALIWKTAFKAARTRTNTNSSILSRAVNIRGKMTPPLTSNHVGNVIWSYRVENRNREVELRDLVREMRQGMKVFDEKYVKMLETGEGLSGYFSELMMKKMSEDVEFYICTSLCNMRVYETDFGWGRPVWVSVCPGNCKNVMVLIDGNKGDGGVEAWVVLSEEDMYLFERDPELLAYGSLNPSVVANADFQSFGVKSSL